MKQYWPQTLLVAVAAVLLIIGGILVQSPWPVGLGIYLAGLHIHYVIKWTRDDRKHHQRMDRLRAQHEHMLKELGYGP